MDREHFYQLPQPIDKYPYLRWIVDSRLRRYIQQRIPKHFSPSEVLEIAKLLVSEVRQLAPINPKEPASLTAGEGDLRGCITAFIAHILFRHPKMGRRMTIQKIFKSLQRHGQGGDIIDTYQTILRLLFNPHKLLENFNPSLDWYDSLSRHIHLKFKNWLIDELRRFLEDEKFGRTNLSLLNRYSIEKSLRFAGEQGDRLSGLLLLHACFREMVGEKHFPTRNPTFAQYDKLLARYQERSSEVNFEIINREQIIKLLQDLGNTFRNYEQPKVTSSDLPAGKNTTTTIGELQEDFQETIILENLINYSEIGKLALNLIQQHSIDIGLLFLYGLELTQVEAGIELNCNQTTVGRNHLRLLYGIAKEFYLKYHKSPPQPKTLVTIGKEYIDPIKSICEDYYPNLLTDILIEIKESSSTNSEVERLFIDRLETQWQFKFKPDGVGLSKVAEFVQRRTNQP